MAQVTSQAELRAAVIAADPQIEVAASFYIDTAQEIGFATTLSSAAGGPFTLTKADGYYGALFQPQAGGSLTLQNITLDGARQTHPEAGTGALVRVSGGTLVLDSGSVVQNNGGNENGGGIYADDESAPTTVILRGNAVIRGNSAPQDGGGLNVVFSQPQSSLQILDQAVIENNETAGNGGGLAYSGPPLTIGGDVKIINNSASGGGGINVIGDELRLTGNLHISENQGGGVSFSGARFQVDEGVSIQNNTCGDERGGGGINLSSVTEALIQGTILGNTAGFGGGIYVEASDRGAINLSGARFMNNRTTSASNGWGGGFYIYRRMPSSYVTALTLDNALFDGNKATLDGGGLCVHYPDQHGGPARFGLTATNCQFLNNTAGRNGGGAYLSGSANGSAAVFQNGSFLGNLAVTGAGLFVTFKDVSRGALTLKYMRIEINTAGEFGGGVALGSGNLDVNLQNVIISGNKARIGGGLYSVDSPGRIDVTDSSQFSRNTADSGGGIYHEGDRTLILGGSEFVQNTAYNGWGVFNSGPLELNLQLKRLEGLFIQSEDDVPVLTSHLAPPTVWLEQSGYVLPNTEGTPIVIARSDLALRQTDAESFVKPEAIFTGWEPLYGKIAEVFFVLTNFLSQ